MYYSKSQAAFLLTCQKLFAHFPRPYFWTFTFTNVMPDWWYPKHWNAFVKDLQNLHGGMVCGVRVIEPHEQHGLHYHAILNVRVSIHLVLRIAKKYGIGRVSVEPCNYGAAQYLVPYLKPTSETKLSEGMRRWGCIGGFIGVKTNAIEVNSPFHRNMALLNKGKKVGFKICHEVFRFSKLYGDLRGMPLQVRNYLRAISLENCDRGTALFFQRKLPVKVQAVASEHIVTPPGMKKYYLRPADEVNFDTVRKRVKLIVDDDKPKEQSTVPVRFGRLIGIGHKWYDESQVKFCGTRS